MDKRFFGLAAAEVASGTLDEALLIKSIALSDGNEQRGRALYIRLRAEELEQEHKRSVRAAKFTAALDVVSGNDEKVPAGARVLRNGVLIVLGLLFFGIPLIVYIGSLLMGLLGR